MAKIRKGDGFKNEYYYVIPYEFQKRFAENPLSSAAMVTDIGLFPNAQYHWCRRPNGTGAAILLYCTAGRGYVIADGGEKRTVGPDNIVILPPGVPHEYGASEGNPWTIFWIHIKGSYFETLHRQCRLPLVSPVSPRAGERMREAFYQCFYILKMPYQQEEYIYLCQLGALIASLVPFAAKQSAPLLTQNGSLGVERAILFMKEHLRETPTLGDFAAAAQFSPSHLHYLFCRSSGYAPMEYFLRMKIQAAARDLFFSDVPVRSIAEAYGVTDPYYFSRLFKKIMGVSPAAYRKRQFNWNGE